MSENILSAALKAIFSEDDCAPEIDTLDLTQDQPNHLRAALCLSQCASSDENFLTKGDWLRSASLTPDGEADVVNDQVLIRIDEIDGFEGKVAFVDGSLTAPPYSDDDYEGYFSGEMHLVDEAIADALQQALIEEHERVVVNETASDLERLLHRVQDLAKEGKPGVLEKLRPVAGQINLLILTSMERKAA